MVEVNGENRTSIRRTYEMRTYNMRKDSTGITQDDRGFSLVELIIVIAIMAILAGALAPALIKYINKSKRAADIQNADQIRNTCIEVASDADIHESSFAGGDEFEFYTGGQKPEVGSNVQNLTAASDHKELADALIEVIGSAEITMKYGENGGKANKGYGFYVYVNPELNKVVVKDRTGQEITPSPEGCWKD